MLELLRADSINTYKERLENFRKIWDPDFLVYFEKHLDGDIQTSFRPVLEGFGAYSELSGLTNNPAESTNAAFKKIMDSKKSTLFQSLSAWYFYQVDILLDIFRGVQNQGDLVPFKKLPENLYVPENVDDIVSKTLISSLVHDGQFPAKMVSAQKYKSKPLHEATTLRGIAQFFIEDDRISWLPKKQVFIVTGLLRRNYMVSKNLAA